MAVAAWPDLAKFHQFGTIFKVFGNIFEGVFSNVHNYETILAKNAYGQICIDVNDNIELTI